MKYTRKGEIERIRDIWWCRKPADCDGELFAKLLDRFGRRERTEARKESIATITRCLAMRERARFVRDKMGSGCPPGKEDCEGLYPTCMECVARYILGDEDGR